MLQKSIFDQIKNRIFKCDYRKDYDLFYTSLAY